METFDIFGLDSPCMDLNANLNALPQRNGGARLNDLSWQGGGKVSSGMVAAARLGVTAADALRRQRLCLLNDRWVHAQAFCDGKRIGFSRRT